MNKQERPLYLFLWIILGAWAAAGFFAEGFISTLSGLLDLQFQPARLIADFSEAAGEGAALLNSAFVAAIGLFLIRINRVRLSGPTVAAVFTMLGFGLFGKTPVNCIPVILGVFISAKIMKKSFREYILIALFGTALGPLVTMLFAELGVMIGGGIPLAAAGGITAGIFLPPLALTMLRFHQGFNLYNIGMTSGFFAVFAAAVITAAKGKTTGEILWTAEPSLLFVLLIPVLSVVLIAAGIVFGKRGVFKGFFGIMKLPGRLPSDFMDSVSPGSALLNMGVLGILFWLYVMIIGGDLNGPVLGGILTIIGFAAFGKHPKNVLPLAAGIAAAILIFGKDFTAPGPLLAFLFGTTLAPIAGEFGPVAGFIGGFLHLAMVERTGAWHLGINLYNNGFAGGLTATFIVSVIEWWRNNRGERPKKQAAVKEEPEVEETV
ncbi:MAG: DUF1576 domain-containing protein [Spirochaetia bacterium]